MTSRHDVALSGLQIGVTANMSPGSITRMSAIRSTRTAARAIPAWESHRDRPIDPTQHSIHGDQPQRTGAGLRSIAPAALRALALVTIAMLLILVFLPAAASAA